VTDLWLPTDAELAELTDEEVAVVLEALEAAKDDEPAWEPQEKQALASYLAGKAVETLYGGAAGGGKSEWLLHHALDQMLAHDFNRGGIFRRVYPSIARTLIPRTKAMYPRFGGRWNGVEHTWTFPNGSVLEMGSLQYADTVLEHQGTEYGFLGFGEVTEFLESQVTYMIGRLRAPAPGIRPHMAATANPGGRGHRWVKRRWVKPKEGDWVEGEGRPVPFRPWSPAPTAANPEPNNRVFVPATLADNPRLLARDPGYINRLRAISDPALRKAMESGDWDAIDAIEGALWQQSWFDQGRVPKSLVQQGTISSVERVVAVDPSDGNESGKGDEYGVWAGFKGTDGVGYTEYSNGWLMSPRKMAEATVALYHALSADAIVVERNHGGRWVKEVLLGVDRYANVVEVWASDGKVTRARPVAALFEPDPMHEPQIRARMVGEHPELEEECTTFTGAPGEASPNRLDAMVWGHTHLMLGQRTVRQQEYDDQRLAGRR
jgi:hypothetical protein